MKAALLLALALLPGCYGLAAIGAQVPATHPDEPEAVLEARAGAGDLRTHPRSGLLGPDLALHTEIGHGVRAAFGSGMVWAPLAGWDHDWTPVIRPGIWLAPIRTGPSHAESIFVPSMDLGAFFYGDRGSNTRSFFTVGTRVEWRGGDGAFGDQLAACVYVGTGESSSLNMPR